MTNCPRCTTDKLRVECIGEEDGNTLWTLYYCLTCHYSFRDTEAQNVLDPARRKAVFNVDPNRLDQFKPALPGMS